MFKFIKRYFNSIVFVLILFPMLQVWFVVQTTLSLLWRLLTWNTKEKISDEELIDWIETNLPKFQNWLIERILSRMG
jgi:hypothetical protein